MNCMEMTDRPSLRLDAPQDFRVACARLMLIWFWASWDGAGEHDAERDAHQRPAQQGEDYGLRAHAITGAAGSGIQ